VPADLFRQSTQEQVVRLIEILFGLGVLCILKKWFASDKADTIILPVDSGRSIAPSSRSDDDLVENLDNKGYRDPSVDMIMADWEDEAAQWEAFDNADDGEDVADR
jgi:hypothetical protein